MKTLMILLATGLSVSAVAEVTPEQAANAALQCAKEAPGLRLSGNEYVESVSVKTKEKKKERTTINTFTIRVKEGRGFVGIMKVGTLTAVQTIVQPDPRAADIPANVSWSCSVSMVQ